MSTAGIANHHRTDDAPFREDVLRLRRTCVPVEEIARRLRIGKDRVRRILSDAGRGGEEIGGESMAADIVRGSARLLDAIRLHHPERCGESLLSGCSSPSGAGSGLPGCSSPSGREAA